MKPLSPVQQKFILHWGEMGARWGINRTVAQIHALLFMSAQPVHAEDIAQTLGVARSNVSTSLKELQGWRIVRRVHVLGDKRDHFESMHDPWEMFRVVLDERKQREIDPTIRLLRECIAEAESGRETDEVTRERLKALSEFFEVASQWYSQIRQWPAEELVKLMKVGSKLQRLLEKVRIS